jgi:hypothetical protein
MYLHTRLAFSFAVVNLLVAVLFGYRAFEAAWLISIDSVAAVTSLDREGVINNDALGAYHPSFGFTTEGPNRNRLADFIAGAAVSAAKSNAVAGIAVALFNAVVFGSMCVHRGTQRGSSAPARAGEV